MDWPVFRAVLAALIAFTSLVFAVAGADRLILGIRARRVGRDWSRRMVAGLARPDGRPYDIYPAEERRPRGWYYPDTLWLPDWRDDLISQTELREYVSRYRQWQDAQDETIRHAAPKSLAAAEAMADKGRVRTASRIHAMTAWWVSHVKRIDLPSWESMAPSPSSTSQANIAD